MNKVFCLSFSDSVNKLHFKTHYYIAFYFHDEIFKPKHIPSRESVEKSWFQAAELCKSVRGTLPIIRSRAELNELINLIKYSNGLPPIELVYVGWKIKHKVRDLLIRYLESGKMELCFLIPN